MRAKKAACAIVAKQERLACGNGSSGGSSGLTGLFSPEDMVPIVRTISTVGFPVV
jgi:hypothetical protein